MAQNGQNKAHQDHDLSVLAAFLSIEGVMAMLAMMMFVVIINEILRFETPRVQQYRWWLCRNSEVLRVQDGLELSLHNCFNPGRDQN